MHTMRFLQLDGAIAFALLNKASGSLAALLSIVLVAKKLSVQEQGYYYTFSSLLAIQLVLELGFGYVLSQVAAHEYAIINNVSANDSSVHAARSRLSNLIRFSEKWYGSVALVFAISASLIGWRFFEGRTNDDVNWAWPWLLTVLAFSSNILLTPLFSMLEGTQQMKRSIIARTVQDIAGFLAFWCSLELGAALFSVAAMQAARCIAATAWLLRTGHIGFVISLRSHIAAGTSIDWQKEILPFQWRIAASTMAGYGIFYLFSPALFAYQGAATAGRMGMTISVLSGLSGISMSWISTKSPTFCAYIARQEFDTLNSTFRLALRTTLTMSAILITLACLTLELASHFQLKVADRFLQGAPLVFLGLASFANQAIFSYAVYLRSFKEEPLLTQSLWMGLLTAMTTLTLAKYSGVTAVALAYAVLTIFYALPNSRNLFLVKRRSLISSS